MHTDWSLNRSAQALINLVKVPITNFQSYMCLKGLLNVNSAAEIHVSINKEKEINFHTSQEKPLNQWNSTTGPLNSSSIWTSQGLGFLRPLTFWVGNELEDSQQK